MELVMELNYDWPEPGLRKWEQSEWDELLERFAFDWRLIPFYNNIILKRDTTLPSTPILYSYHSANDPYTTFWFLYKQCDIGIDDTIVLVACEGTFVASNFRRAFEEFYAVHPIFELEKVLVRGDVELCRTIKSYADMDTRLEVKDVHVTLVYYCNEETRDRIKHGKIPTLPQPYELGVADIDGDSQKINRTWIYGEKTVKGDEKMRHRLEHLPNAVIHNASKPVAFIFTNSTGTMNHLFVEEKHRRKGLGYIVEFALAQKLAQRGYIPTKQVLLSNTFVVASSDRSPLWTKAINDDGSYGQMGYLDIYRNCHLYKQKY